MSAVLNAFLALVGGFVGAAAGAALAIPRILDRLQAAADQIPAVPLRIPAQAEPGDSPEQDRGP